ncbi:hypothetical protein LD771_03740 [Salmonella enterica]|nr:hypothetical protein [Salmonella enterica]
MPLKANSQQLYPVNHEITFCNKSYIRYHCLTYESIMVWPVFPLQNVGYRANPADENLHGVQ